MDQHLRGIQQSLFPSVSNCLWVTQQKFVYHVSAYFFTKVFVQYIQIFLNCFLKYSYSFSDLPLKISKVNDESSQFMIQGLNCKTQCAFQVIYLSSSFNYMSCFFVVKLYPLPQINKLLKLLTLDRQICFDTFCDLVSPVYSIQPSFQCLLQSSFYICLKMKSSNIVSYVVHKILKIMLTCPFLFLYN